MPARKTIKDFIKQAKDVHYDRYDYSAVDYKNHDTKVKIICRKHGEFYQSPRKHLAKRRGCPDCGGSKRLTNSQFIERSIVANGDKYDYSLVEYINNIKKVKIICNIHGVFMKTPSRHMNGEGCQKCSRLIRDKKTMITKDDFIRRARIIHGDTYDYSNAYVIGAHSPVVITCKVHGDFSQVLNNHLQGKGCAACTKGGFDTGSDGFVYLLESKCGKHIKIGMTNNPTQRISILKKKTPFLFKSKLIMHCDGDTTRAIESFFHDKLLSADLGGFDGCTEWFIRDNSVFDQFKLFCPDQLSIHSLP